jgi:hypothetical protein
MPGSGAPPGFGPGGGKMPGSGAPPGFGPPGFNPQGGAAEKPKKSDDPTSSQLTIARDERTINFTLDLVMDKAAFDRVLGVATLTAASLRVEMDLAMYRLHHELAKAAKQMADKGLSELGVPPGQYPPAAFPAGEAKNRLALEPKNRVGWMAGLLPFLGHQELFGRISFKHNWRDPVNWIAARTVVPEFVDPTYPDASRQVLVNGIPIDFGATHFVGLAGVGLDAADYPRDDPAWLAKRGVFGYDKSATLKEVQDGRGLSNAIVLIQVPHDGPGGVAPWIAGGGATVRGVPEKNSIAPFVLGTDKYGKVIQYQGKRGTYALMADGSVRFIDQNVSDDVFKAMATVGGGAPEDFDLKTNKSTPLVPAPSKDDMRPELPPVAVKPTGKAPETAKGPKLPPGWVPFNGDGYSLAMPMQPLSKEEDHPALGKVLIHGAPLKGTQYIFQTAAVGLPPAELSRAKTPEGLKQLALVGTPAGAKVTAGDAVTQDGVSGTEVFAEAESPEAGKITVLARGFVVNDRLVVLHVIGNGDVPAQSRDFFESLRFAGQAAPPAPPAPPANPQPEPNAQRPPAKGPDPADAKAPAGWVNFKGDGYTVSMPNEPKPLKQALPNGAEMNMNMAMVLDKGLVLMSATIPVPAEELGKTNNDDAFRLMALGMASKGGKVLKEAPVSLGAYKGRDYLLSMEAPGPNGAKLQLTAHVRLYIAEKGVVMLMVTGPTVGQNLPPEGAAFFNSLKIGG